MGTDEPVMCDVCGKPAGDPPYLSTTVHDYLEICCSQACLNKTKRSAYHPTGPRNPKHDPS